MVNDLLTATNMRSIFDFYIGSFSRDPDDLGQWRAYGDNGCGFSLGLASHLYHVSDKPDRKPHENIFVTPVVYGDDAGRQRQLPAIEKAASIVDKVVNSSPELDDINVGMPFFDEMAKVLIASQIIWNSLTIKHEAYKHENEVRLIIVGQNKKLHPYVSTRSRSGDIVPFIKSDMPIQDEGSIVEIVVGPAAAHSAEDGVRKLLQPYIANPDRLISRSKIPYRVVR